MAAELDLAIENAWKAHERADWLGAIDCWKICLQLEPSLVAAYWMAGAILITRGRLEEAEAMLSAGVALDPDHILMGVEHARAATGLKNWPEAIRRWNVLASRAPDTKEVMDGRADAEMQIQMYRMDEVITGDAGGIDWDRFVAGTQTSTDTELFMRFESLGDNCEFGLAQRHFRAEPVSLLRWNSIGIEALTNAIETGLQGIGEPQHTVLEVGQHDEYLVRDHRYGMGMHTFLKTSTVTEGPAELYAKMCQRQAYLARKLVEDLEDAAPIFVFKAVEGASLENVRRLHEAMGRHGPNCLLFVTKADKSRPAGSVEQIAPGLFMGAIDHFVRAGLSWDNIDFNGWRLLCLKVWSKVKASADPGTDPLRSAYQALEEQANGP